MQERIFNAMPKAYGSAYLCLIPIYAIIYYLFPALLNAEQSRSFIACLYFSVVTITTLGYGDITPSGDLGFSIAASEAVLGVVLIGLFLNSLSRVRSELTRSEEIEKEKRAYKEAQISKLNGHFNLIEPLIEKYRLGVIQITSPLSARNTEYNPDFTLKDMRDLYGPTLLMTQNHQEPAVNYYFSALNHLSSEIADMVKSVDLRLFPELEKQCLFFIQTFHSFDFSDAIRGAVNLRVGDKTMKDFVKEMLEKNEGEPTYKKSNMLNAYVALYHQIKNQMAVIEQLKNEVRGIRTEG